MHTRTPQCIGYIMDGNRRWAKKQKLPTLSGHTRGARKLKEVVRWAQEAGIESVIVYAFSTENWNRAQKEVSHLMNLFRTVVHDEAQKLAQEGVRLRFLGNLTLFPADIQQMMTRLEKETALHTPYTLAIAASYGGRAEIVAACNRMLQSGVTTCTEDSITTHLWSNDVPHPDMIIRTGGERRLSNFLTWQSVYSELFFTNTYWPDFGKEEFNAMLEEYGKRERRYGA